MNDEAEFDYFWVEEIDGKVQTPKRKKRILKPKKKEYVGWGSTSLIQFLESIGKDTSKQISQNNVTEIVNEYAKQNNLLHPTKKKRIVCDERLHLLFGRKSIGRLKIHDLLESHFAENYDESDDDDFLFNSDDDETALATSETQKTTTSERKTQLKKQVMEKPKSCFAAIIPFNIKLVYLKRSLVEELLKDPETFETKVVGSFIRIRCDPNDYLQKNSHQILQVTGIKKGSGMNDKNGEILLQASGFIKHIDISKLSDDNFSEEECEDLCQRVRDGLLKRPMIVDLEQMARVLHEDITKHWIARELTSLQNLIERANEKGWRRDTLDEYLRKREKLQSPDEQARLLHEIPQVIADDLESESTTPDVPDKKVENNVQKLWQTTCKPASLVAEVPKAVADGFVCKAAKPGNPDHAKQETNSPKSILSPSGASEVPLFNMAGNGTVLNFVSGGTDSAEHYWYDIPVQQRSEQQIELAYKNDGNSKPAESKEAKVSQRPPGNQVWPFEVIELSDDEENEEPSPPKQSPAVLLKSLTWYYRDPQGDIQGPFSLTSLKGWSDANYFAPDFKVWKAGQSQDEGVLLVDILHQFFPS